MAHPSLSALLLLLAAAAGLLAPRKVVAEPEEEARARCPEGVWPLPPKVSPRLTYSRRSHGPAYEDVSFLYHPCAHPWLKLQLAALAHAYVAQPSLATDASLSQDRPLMLAAWGVALELAWVEPAWVAHWLKRWRWRKKQRKKAWSRSDSLSVPSPLASTPGRGRLCQRGCVKAPSLAFTLRSWRPPGTAVPPAGPGKLVPGGVRMRRLRAVLGLQTTPAATRVPSASTWHFHKQPIWGAQGEGGHAPLVPTVPLLPAGPQGNASTQLETQGSKGKGGPGGCTCPTQASLAPRAAAPPRAALGPTPRTEEAAWAAMALTFLLVLLTLATLCTRLHRNFRRGESIYWGPTLDSQDTVAAVLKRRLLLPPRRIKRSRGRLLPPTLDSGPDGDSSD